MITGYNTDVEFQGVTYHVQTEDKGLANPIILSLVYIKGTILASKRTPYDDLVAGGFDEDQLEERLNRQHRLICAAIKAGRLDDLKKLSEPGPPRGKSGKRQSRKKTETAAAASASTPATTVGDTDELLSPIPKPDSACLSDLDSLMAPYEPEISVVRVLDSEPILASAAVTAVECELAGTERPANNYLTVEIFGDTEFRGGERRSVGVMVCRGTNKKIVARAQVMLKIIGTSFRPLIYHAETDANGIARVDLQVPKFKSGRAAFVVRAMSGGEAAELRQAVQYS